MKSVVKLLVILPALVLSQWVWAQGNLEEELQKARDLVMKGEKEGASVLLANIMNSHPHNKQAVQYWLMANMKRSPTGELDAVKQLDSLHAVYPGNTGILFFKTFILAEYGKNDEALALFDQLIALQPDTALNWIGKGQVLSAMEKYEEALGAFEKATLLDPGRFDVWGMKAACLTALKKYDEALTVHGKVIEMAPEYVTGLYNRACTYSLMGNKAKALIDLKAAVEKNPRFKQHARTDKDFQSLWEDEEFRKLTE